MKPSDNSVSDLIQSVDPAPDDPLTPSSEVLRERARQLTIAPALRQATRPRRRRRLARPVLIAAIGIAALAVAVPILIPTSAPPAKAATPPTLTFKPDPRNGAAILRAMAATLREQPTTPQTTRRNGAILTTEGFALVTSESGKGSAVSAWFSKKITTYIEIGRDGTGTTRITSLGSEPHFANEADRKAWTDSGAGEGPGNQTVTESTPTDTLAWYTRPPLGKEAFLSKVFSRQPDRSTDMLLNGIAENLATTVLEPGQRAALLDNLAARSDVRFVGTTIDRAGRMAYGFAHDSDRAGLPTRHILLISPEGDILSYEQVLTRDAGNLNVTIPATISYTLYLSAKYR
ncbi:hypothetical protein PWY87_26930 [Kribbella solani]|uniref:hypothetical protein n=1 Tax=Kribbella solani TaxID=236067 RepID=UPI00299FD168|nr:hypothetical protein [Kribbella solani]MDX3005340.1 hypothetical protein [Kribbella solani]